MVWVWVVLPGCLHSLPPLLTITTIGLLMSGGWPAPPATTAAPSSTVASPAPPFLFVDFDRARVRALTACFGRHRHRLLPPVVAVANNTDDTTAVLAPSASLPCSLLLTVRSFCCLGKGSVEGMSRGAEMEVASRG